jgi:cobalamin biosynthesis protein CobD/CbiB
MLGGGAEYNGVFEERPKIGDDLKEPEASDILRAHSILDASVALCALILLCLFVICN